MTENLALISELRNAKNNLYPIVSTYYSIKKALEILENQS